MIIIKQTSLGLVELDTAIALGKFLIVEDDVIVLVKGFFGLLGMFGTNLNDVGLRHIRNLRFLLLFLKLDSTLLGLLAHLRTHL